MDEAFLCLKCRQTGHVVKRCPTPWPSFSGTQKWAFSDDRVQLLANIRASEQKEICPRCRDLHILSMFEGDLDWKGPYPLQIALLQDSPHYRNLGEAGDVVFRKDCPMCICLFASAPNPRAWSDEVHVLAEWSIHRLERLVEVDSDAKNRYDKCLLVDILPRSGVFKIDEHQGDAIGLLRTPDTDLALSPRILNSSSLDFDWIKECLSICEHRHGPGCTPLQNLQSEDLPNISLLDVETRMLVPHLGDESEYICLSYVWGPVSIMRFARDQVIPHLPRTIEDAMILCRSLGKRYLWVDSICIDQDNLKDKMQNISRMSVIYKGAYATVVALSGSSMEAGLARVGKSNRSPQHQLSCNIDGRQLVGLMPTLSQQTHNTTWGSRAWTLQEALLSNRCIYVSDHQVYFECNTMQCSESLEIKSSWIHQMQRGSYKSGHKGEIFGHGTLRNAHPGVEKPGAYMTIYGTLISLFSFREMTRDSDALNAFSGILQHLRMLAHPSGFFWGLPLDELNWSLMWCTYSQGIRRKGFPEWSWAGWKVNGLQPGWPSDINDPHGFWTHFYAWKVEKERQQLLFPTGATPPYGMRREQVFDRVTIFDNIADMPAPKEPTIGNLLEAESEGILVVDCAICDLDLKVGTPNPSMDYGPYLHLNVILNGVACILSTVAWTRETLGSENENVSIKSLALVGRQRWDGWVYHHFLKIDTDSRGRSRRSGVFVLIVPLLRPETLESLQVSRVKLVLQ